MKTKNEEILVKALLSELNDAEKKELEVVLHSDESAAETLNDFEKVKNNLKSFKPDFSEGFEQSVLQRLAQLSTGQTRQGRVFRLMLRLTMSASAAVLLLLLYVIWQENSLSLDGLLGLAGLKSDDFTNLLVNY